MKNKNLFVQLLEVLGQIAILPVKKIMRSMLWVDRNILKAYCGIETPLYKFWWANHSANMQAKLNLQHRVYVVPMD